MRRGESMGAAAHGRASAAAGEARALRCRSAAPALVPLAVTPRSGQRSAAGSRRRREGVCRASARAATGAELHSLRRAAGGRSQHPGQLGGAALCLQFTTHTGWRPLPALLYCSLPGPHSGFCLLSVLCCSCLATPGFFTTPIATRSTNTVLPKVMADNMGRQLPVNPSTTAFLKSCRGGGGWR